MADVIKSVSNLIINYQNSARQRGFDWKLTFEESRKLFTDECYYCGTPPLRVLRIGNYDFFYNGIDRVDNKRGYTSDNVASCCWVCNKAKGDMTLPAFKDWVDHVHATLLVKDFSQFSFQEMDDGFTEG